MSFRDYTLTLVNLDGTTEEIKRPSFQERIVHNERTYRLTFFSEEGSKGSYEEYVFTGNAPGRYDD